MYAGVASQGRDMGGLAAYLFGPGKANEHTDPHVVASGKSDMFQQAWGGVLSRAEARELGHAVEANFRVMRQMNHRRSLAGAGVGAHGGAGHYGVDRDTTERPHVFHAYLSLRADEGTLSDEKWHDIAHDYMREMFGDRAEKMDWIAVRHGLSKAGNDHVHLAVNLVTEDHEYADTRQSFNRSKNAARVLEQRHDLAPMLTNERARATGNYHRVEREKNPQVREQSMLPSARLARAVRGAGMAARDEAEFLMLLRDRGVAFAPRWENGGRQKVVGYSVKLRDDEDGVWRGGGKLARDLTLTRLRERWQQPPEKEHEALALWSRTKPVPAREGVSTVDADKAVGIAVQHLDLWRKEIRALDPDDRLAWKQEAGRLAGVFGELGDRHEGRLGRDMRWMARRYERLAQDRQETRVQPGKGRAEKAVQHMDLAFNSARMMAPGSNAVLAAGVMRVARAAEQLERARTGRIETERRLEAEHAEIALLDARMNRVESAYRELAGATSAASRPVREQAIDLPPETYRESGNERGLGRY